MTTKPDPTWKCPEHQALDDALRKAAEEDGYTGEYAVYRWLDDTPRATIVARIIQALHGAGHEIRHSLKGRTRSAAPYPGEPGGD